MHRYSLLACLALVGCATNTGFGAGQDRPSSDGLASTVLLIGDAGDPLPNDPVLEALTHEIALAPDRTTVVFLGDNVYPNGMPERDAPTRAEAERRLNSQVSAAAAAAATYFLPGNHDWDYAGDDGWDAIRRQADYLAESGPARMLPTGGCPGPEVIDSAPYIRLILLDTQWWFENGERPGRGSSCPNPTLDAVGGAIAEAIASAGGREVVIAAHHPLLSSGPHGGRFTILDHLFPLRHLASWAWIPLPVLGSAYPIARMSGISRQDESSSTYKELKRVFLAAFAARPPLVYAGGHEHALEVHPGPGAEFTLVSGGGSGDHTSSLRPVDGTLFASDANGFMRIDAYQNGRVRLTVVAIDDAGNSVDAWGDWIR